MLHILTKIALFILVFFMVSEVSFSQENPLKGTVKVRKRKMFSEEFGFKKRIFDSRENPLAGKWELKEYEINDKPVSLNVNTHYLEFYDSTYRFKRIYKKPRSKIYEGTFPVYLFRKRVNAARDTLVKFKNLNIQDYHMLYDSDTLVVTELVDVEFLNFTYSPSKITFVVKEFDKNKFLIRKLYFVYAKS